MSDEATKDEVYLDALLKTTQAQSGFIEDLAQTVETLAEQVDKRPTKSFMYKVGGAVAAVVVALVLFLNIASYQSSNDALDRIESCTDPEGECAQRGAQGQVQAIGQIVCNQEKIVYFADETYTPLPYCAVFINTEIERTDTDLPPLKVETDIQQINPLTE